MQNPVRAFRSLDSFMDSVDIFERLIDVKIIVLDQ